MIVLIPEELLHLVLFDSLFLFDAPVEFELLGFLLQDEVVSMAYFPALFDLVLNLVVFEELHCLLEDFSSFSFGELFGC